MAIVVPTLSSAGWLTSIDEQADAMLANFFTVNSIQTQCFRGEILSVQTIFQEYQHDVPALCSKLANQLELYLQRVFDSALVEVSSDYQDPNPQKAGVTLKVYMRVSRGGKDYSVAKLIEGLASNFQRITSLNNGDQANG